MRSKPPRRRSLFASLAAAALVHLLVGMALLLWPAAPMLPAAEQESVTVAVLTPQQFEAATRAPVAAMIPPAAPQDAALPARPNDPAGRPAAERPPIVDADPPPPAEPSPPGAPSAPLSAEERLPAPAPIPSPQPAASAETFGVPAPPPPPRPAPPPPKPAETAMIVARTLYAQKILADPKSRSARAGLAELAGSERMIQLCNLEAMEQVHRWRDSLQPDFLIAYASGDAKLSNTAVIADGAAVRSNKHWFSLRYDCRVAGDGQSVAALSFSLGPEIPTAQWEALGLALDSDPAD